ncbi:MAG: hypothetical protein AABY32_01200 [Nanoarchaeota archaeon]
MDLINPKGALSKEEIAQAIAIGRQLWQVTVTIKTSVFPEIWSGPHVNSVWYNYDDAETHRKWLSKCEMCWKTKTEEYKEKLNG